MTTEGQEPILRQVNSGGTIEIVNRDDCADRFECSIEALDRLVADHNAKCGEVDALRAERDDAIKDRAWWHALSDRYDEEALEQAARAEQAETRLKELERSFGPDHVVEIGPGDWTLQHPLACRPDLLACRFNAAMHRTFPEPPDVEPGRYAALLDEDGFVVLRRALSGEERP